MPPYLPRQGFVEMRMSPGGILAFMPNRQLALPAHLGLETCQALESTIDIWQVHS
jgi:hypothetical protein